MAQAEETFSYVLAVKINGPIACHQVKVARFICGKSSAGLPDATTLASGGAVKNRHLAQAGLIMRENPAVPWIVVLVHVDTGGQAIVGSVSQAGGRESDENRGQPHAPENAGAITFAPGTTLPSANEARDAMPVASGRR